MALPNIGSCARDEPRTRLRLCKSTLAPLQSPPPLPPPPLTLWSPLTLRTPLRLWSRPPLPRPPPILPRSPPIPPRPPPIPSRPPPFLGDFNFHLDNGSDANANRFTSLLHSLDFEQHVSSPIHRSGHTLDAIISRSGYGLVSNVHVGDLFFDHCLILCFLSHTKTPRPRKTVSIRKCRTLDIPAVTSDVGDRLALVPISADSSQMLNSLSTIFMDVLDAHAPHSFKDIDIRPQQLWYTDELRAGKKSS